MQYKNKFNLPEHIVRMLPQIYKPQSDRLPVTTLIGEPLPRTLMITKWDDLVVDWSDQLSLVRGLALHSRAERFVEDEEQAEQKLEDKVGDFTVVGKADTYIESLKWIRDTKDSATRVLNFPDTILSWERQCNVYAWQYRRRGYEVEKLTIDLWMRDWKLRESLVKKDYPPCQYKEITLPLWTFEQQEQFVRDQVEFFTMEPYAACTPEFRWHGPDTWAVKSNGKKRAERVLDTEAEALAWKNKNRGDFIEKRTGEDLKCKYYCRARSVCHFAKNFCVI